MERTIFYLYTQNEYIEGDGKYSILMWKAMRHVIRWMFALVILCKTFNTMLVLESLFDFLSFFF